MLQIYMYDLTILNSMELKDRFLNLQKAMGLNTPKFAEALGFNNPQTVREILYGRTKTLSKAARLTIQAAQPLINVDWLTSGVGKMYKPPMQQTSSGLQSPNLNGSGNVVQSGNNNANGIDKDELVLILSATNKSLAKIDRLDKDITVLRTECNSQLAAKDEQIKTRDMEILRLLDIISEKDKLISKLIGNE